MICDICGSKTVMPTIVHIAMGNEKKDVCLCENCAKDMQDETKGRELVKKVLQKEFGNNLFGSTLAIGIKRAERPTKFDKFTAKDFVGSKNAISDKFKMKNDSDIPTPKQIKAMLDEYVIGQDEAKVTLAVGIYNHYKRVLKDKDNTISKSNILMIGSTGVGKTELARTIAKVMNVPFTIASVTNITQAGYVGDDIEDIIESLLNKCDGNVEEAERGIVYVDELDKIARKSEGLSANRDVAGEAVQDSLLELLEGKEVTIKGKNMFEPSVTVNTSGILFILGGAFEGLTMTKQTYEKTIGFNNDIDAKKKELDEMGIVEQLRKNGLKPELLGRTPIIVRLHDLDEKDLKRILVEPKNSITKQFERLIALDGVKLKFTDKALAHISHKALENKTGARGLRSVMEQNMKQLMYELPDMKNVIEVTVGVKNGKINYNYKKESKS